MSDDGWWARQLGRAPQPRQEAPTQYPPPAYPPQQPGYPPQYQQPPQGYQQPQPGGHGLNTHNIYEAAMSWQGGQATRTETIPCPECGSPHFFSRTNGATMRGPAPAPMCADCGFNGMFQQGDPAVWQGAAGQ